MKIEKWKQKQIEDYKKLYPSAPAPVYSVWTPRKIKK
jgi:hypothetical protein